MTFRKFDTCTWKDHWFENLNHKEKLAFIYFWTNDYCNQAGIYEISQRRIEFDIGYGIDMVSEALKEKVEWFPGQSVVWVKNFFKHQCQNKNFAISALKSLNGDSFKIQIFIKYNLTLLNKFEIDLKSYGFHTV